MNCVVVSSVFLLWVCFAALSQGCRPGWVAHGDYCYLYKHETYTFFEAKVTCDLFNSHLTEIHSDEENAFLTKLINDNHGDVAWIGLDDLEVEAHFEWYYSHDKPDYTSWLPSDPNDYHDEDCVTTRHDGQWQDWHCETEHPFICQTLDGEDLIG